MLFIQFSIFVIFFVAGSNVIFEIDEPHVPVSFLFAISAPVEISWFESRVSVPSAFFIAPIPSGTPRSTSFEILSPVVAITASEAASVAGIK